MIEALHELVKQAASDDREAQEYAVFQLALLLEKNSTPTARSTSYESLLRPDVLELSLDESDLRELVDELHTLVRSDRMTSSMIWAIGKAKTDNALRYLVSLIGQECAQLTEEAVWQALIGLDNFLSVRTDDPPSRRWAYLAREYKLLTALRQIDQYGSARLNDLARRVLNKISDK